MLACMQTPRFVVILVVLLNCNMIPSFAQDKAPLESNKKTITRYFDLVINAHNLDRKGAFFEADYILHTMEGKSVHSSQDSMHNSLLRWLFAAVPDVQYTISNIVAGGEMVGVNTIATGTAKNEMFGLPAGTGKVRFEQMFMFRLKDGKITDQWEVVDAAGITAQLVDKK